MKPKKQKKPRWMSQRAYVKLNGRGCPVCRSDNIEGDGVEIDASGASQAVSCVECGASWTDHYKLTDYTKTGEPE